MQRESKTDFDCMLGPDFRCHSYFKFCRKQISFSFLLEDVSKTDLNLTHTRYTILTALNQHFTLLFIVRIMMEVKMAGQRYAHAGVKSKQKYLFYLNYITFNDIV